MFTDWNNRIPIWSLIYLLQRHLDVIWRIKSGEMIEILRGRLVDGDIRRTRHLFTSVRMSLSLS